MGFSAVVRVASRRSHGDKVSLCTTAGNLVGHKGCKGEQSDLSVVPGQSGGRLESSHHVLLTMGNGCFSVFLYVGSIQLCLERYGGQEEQETLLPERGASLQLCYQLLWSIFSLREFFANPLAEQLIHCFSTSVLFSLL